MIVSGLVSVTFRALTPKQIIELVRNTDLRSIEWGGDVHVPHGDLACAREVRQMTKDAGITVSAYGSYYRLGVSAPNGDSFESIIETAHELRAPTIRVWAGGRSSDRTPDDVRGAIVDEAREIAKQADRAGISVSFEYHQDTLTDTNDSARLLMQQVNHGNLYTFWQPPNGRETEYCLSGLRDVLPYLNNVHVFHWWPNAENVHLLSRGEEHWKQYLAEMQAYSAQSRRSIYASIEFVKNDSVGAFQDDARTLCRWLQELPAEG